MSHSDRTARALARAESDLTALLDLSQSLTKTTAIDDTLFRISELMAEALESDRCSIILLDLDRNDGIVVATSDDRSLKDFSIDLDEYPEIQKSMHTNDPLIVDDVRQDAIFDDVRDKIRDKPVGSAILFPVSIEHDVQAVLHLRTERALDRELTPREIRFGRIVANTTGIAIRNARVYERVRHQSERRLSERIRAERRLRQIEKYQRFFDFAGDGLMIIDAEGHILFANRAAASVLGADQAALTRRTLGTNVRVGATSSLKAIMQAVADGAYHGPVDLEVDRTDGSRAVLSVTAAPLEDRSSTEDLPPLRRRRGGAGQRSRRHATAILSFQDVTETREIENELRRTKDFLMNLIASSADAIVAADMEGRVILFNHAAEEITGYSQAEILGKPVKTMYPNGTAARIMEELRSLEHGGLGRLSMRRQQLVTKSHELVPVNLAASIVYDQGKEVATVGIFSDLRDRIRLEDELQQAQRQLELTERQSAVAELAGAAAHELNQPLTSIIGNLELMMRKPALDATLRTHVEALLAEADRMEAIVKKIGQVTRYRRIPYVGDTSILDLDAVGAVGSEEA